MNHESATQPQFDYRTGRDTYIHAGHLTPAEWKACADLNRRRAGAIKAAIGRDSPGRPVPHDVWAAAFERTAWGLEVPLINLEKMGFHEDDVSAIASRNLSAIGLGREATAWLDDGDGTVYKLFDLKVAPDRQSGSIGLMLEMTGHPDHVEILDRPANLPHVLDKICALHSARACPTEICGLSEDGCYLIVKQPKCLDFKSFHEDRQKAVEAMNAVAPKGSFGRELWVFHTEGRDWLLSDLHQGNIRILSQHGPTVIDALLGVVSVFYQTHCPKLKDAVMRARALSRGEEVPPDDPFHGISDDDL